jgi:hypothetical protein
MPKPKTLLLIVGAAVVGYVAYQKFVAKKTTTAA